MIVRLVARVATRVFFRSVEVGGLDRFPRSGPVLVVANHPNGLVDPTLLTGWLPVRPRFLGAVWLWRVLPLRPILAFAGVIPVTRPKDAAGGPVDNTAVFAACHAALARGGAIALFPEGTSHGEPHLQPLRTGAARIALEGMTAHGVKNLRIVPVGLLFDRKEIFRSRALLRIGEPLDPAPEAAAHAAAPQDAVRALTARLEAALREVTLNHATPREVRLVARASAILARPALDVPEAVPLALRLDALQAFATGYHEVRSREPARVAAVMAALERYDRRLRLAGLRDGQVASRYPAARVAAFTALSVLGLLALAPFALAGALLNCPTSR